MPTFMFYLLKFMGVILIGLSILKFLDLKGFAHAYSMYDPIAKKSEVYAYIYPLIEFILGMLFLTSQALIPAAWVLLVVMGNDLVGVTNNIFFSKSKIKCACLGTFIKVPLTKFTFVEDIVMILMALMIILL